MYDSLLSDPIYLSLLIFTLAFFGITFYYMIRRILTFIAKEKELNSIEAQYENLCSHRTNLFVII